MCECVRVLICDRVFISLPQYVCARMCVCVHVYVLSYICVYMCLCLCVCTCACLYPHAASGLIELQTVRYL
jgi:hypothetical protein